jgi:hypothetical protein
MGIYLGVERTCGHSYARAIIGYPPMPRPLASATMTRVCGAPETVTHVLVDCPNPRDIRRKLRSETGDAFNSISSLLGGSTDGKRGKPDSVSRARTVKAVLDFAEASQRFKNRAP